MSVQAVSLKKAGSYLPFFFSYGSAPQFNVPEPIMREFRVYDANADGYIDPYEFGAVAHDLNLTIVGEGGNYVGCFRFRFYCASQTFIPVYFLFCVGRR